MSTTRRWLALLTTIGFAAAARAQTDSVEVYFDDPRPLNAAVFEFVKRHPITITYEDPRFEFAGDIRDVTDEVRRSPNPTNQRTLVPRRSILQTRYEVHTDTGEPVDVASALRAMVEAKNANPVGGRFELYRTGQAFHVVPTEVRLGNGAWVRHASVLDVPISLTLEETDGYHLLEAILEQVSAASGQDVRGPVMGSLSNPLFRSKGSLEATDEWAREVLLTALRAINPRFSWMLNYDPSGRYYIFAIVIGAEPPPPAVDPFAFPRPRPGDPTPAGPSFQPR